MCSDKRISWSVLESPIMLINGVEWYNIEIKGATGHSDNMHGFAIPPYICYRFALYYLNDV